MYFPAPYPDELLGSVFIRASHHLGLTPRALHSALSNRSDGELSFVYPCAIAEVTRLLSMSRREVLLQHTVFPYVCIGLDSARRSDLEEQLSESTAPSGSLRLRSTFPGHIEALSFRRLCRKCQRSDIETWGEDYWHRIHALPGVLVCPIHGSPLHSSRVPLLAHISPKYNVLPHEVPCDQGGESINEAQLRTLASEVEAALRPEASFWDYCLQSCQHAALSCGYEYRAHAKTGTRLAVDFEGYFGRSLLGRARPVASGPIIGRMAGGSASWPTPCDAVAASFHSSPHVFARFRCAPVAGKLSHSLPLPAVKARKAMSTVGISLFVQ
ncbi:TniQ family protein [Paraburkholderia strydomiana]